MHKSITIERVMQLVKDDDCVGICKSCGEENYTVEPDARNYECEVCGENQVFGAEELLTELV
jgi:hypothetical protein